MMNLGFGEILLLLVMVLLFIGPKKLPGLAKGLGKGMKEFNDALRGITSTDAPKPEDSTHTAVNTAEDTTAEAEPEHAEPHDHDVDHSDLDNSVASEHHHDESPEEELVEAKSEEQDTASKTDSKA